MNTIPKAALNQHIAILGKTGSGKSYAAKGVVEQLLDEDRQVCVLDPTGAWWGLRLGMDGKTKGYSVVVLLGGVHADIPLAERSGAAVARLVTEQGASVVIDTSGFTVGEYTRWFIDFAGTLYTTIRAPLHLVIDEAHHFMPQGKSPDVDAGRMLHAGNRLMSGGRSKGLRGLLITQRPAKLHKDSLTCADTLVAMRMIAPQDRSAVKAWIDGAGNPEQGRKVLDSLAGLARGEGWVWYPEGGYLERVKFPRIKTYDSSATPEHGATACPKIAEINLDAVRNSMAEAVREAEANDPRLLRRRIAELEAALKKAQPDRVQAGADPKAVERAVAARDRHWMGELAKVQRANGALAGRLIKISALAHMNGQAVVEVTAPEAAVIRQPPRLEPAPTPKPTSRSATGVGESMPDGERLVLTACAQYPGGCSREQIGILTGYKRSTRDAYILRLCSKGYTEVRGDTVLATRVGVDALGAFEELPTGAALRDYWINRLPDGERACLEAVCGAWPNSIDRERVGEATGYKRSTRDAYLQRLRTRRLVESTRDGVRASDMLFDGATA